MLSPYFKWTREGKCPDVMGRVPGRMGREARAGTGRSEREEATVRKVLGCFFFCQDHMN